MGVDRCRINAFLEEKWDGVVHAYNEARRRRIANPFLSALALISAVKHLSEPDAKQWQKRHQKETSSAYPWIGRLLAASEDPITRISGAVCLGTAGLWDETWPMVEQILSSDDDDARRASDELREVFLIAAAAGQTDKALAVLEAAPAKALFEPLHVALRQLAEQPVHAPPEVLEIASDLVQLIEQQRRKNEKGKAKEKLRLQRNHTSSDAELRPAGKTRAAAGH
jgi:hypothetical protein